MRVRKPSIEELRKAAEAHHMRLTDQELAAYRDLMDNVPLRCFRTPAPLM